MDTSSQYGQQNFSLPHDVVKLPSNGVFYKSKKKSIKVGYLTAADENLLMAGGDYGKDGLIMTLLRNKIYEPEIKPDELLQGDIQAILIFLRNTAFGPEYSFKISDPETGKEFESTILLDELHIKECKVTPNEDGTFTTVLPKSNLKVKLNKYDPEQTPSLKGRNFLVGRNKPYEFENKYFVVKLIQDLPIMRKEFAEARGNATSDYQNYLEKTWLEELNKKYPARVNYDILYNLDKK